MCGIYGILALDGTRRHDVSVLAHMGNAIVHRGPDDSGAFEDGDLLLGMRRLSIIDVAGGHQPISSEDGQVVVVCNGVEYTTDEHGNLMLPFNNLQATAPAVTLTCTITVDP